MTLKAVKRWENFTWGLTKQVLRCAQDDRGYGCIDDWTRSKSREPNEENSCLTVFEADDIVFHTSCVWRDHDRPIARTAPRHRGRAHPENAVVGADAWLLDREVDRTANRRRTRHRRRRAVSGAPPAGEARMDRSPVGALREQPEGEVLPAHRRRPSAAPRRGDADPP